MAWHLAGFEVVHGATRRPPEVSPDRAAGGARARRRAWPRAAASRASTGARSHAWRAEADRAHPLCARRAHAGGIPGRPSARRALGAGRAARAGDRRPYRDLGRARRAGRRQRRPRDDDRLVAEADGLERRRGAGRRSGGWRLGDRPACAARARARRRRRREHRLRRTCATGWPPGSRGRDRSRPEPALRPGPHSRRLVRDPLRGSPTDLAKLPPRRADRADIAGRRAGALAAAELRAGRVRSGAGPGRRHRRPGSQAGLPLETGAARMATRPTTSSCRRASAARTARKRCASTSPGRSTWSTTWPRTTTTASASSPIELPGDGDSCQPPKVVILRWSQRSLAALSMNSWSSVCETG